MYKKIYLGFFKGIQKEKKVDNKGQNDQLKIHNVR